MLGKKYLLMTAAIALTAITLARPATAQDPRSPEDLKKAQQEKTTQLLEVLKTDGLTAKKAAAFEELAVFGSRDAIPVLVPMLADEKLSHYARFSLQAIPDSAVDAAFRKALDQLEGKLLIGVINSIGVRKDAKAVMALAELLTGDDVDVATAAAAALGRIADSSAIAALKETLTNGPPSHRSGTAIGCVVGAENLAKAGKLDSALSLYASVTAADVPKNILAAALRGTILAQNNVGITLMAELLKSDDPEMVDVALRTAREMPSDDVLKMLTTNLGSLQSSSVARVILALGDLGSASTVPTLLAAVESGPTKVRVAAIRGLMKIGNATAVPALWKAAAESDPSIADPAIDALAKIPDGKVDAAILGHLKGDAPRSRQLALNLIAQRRITSAVPQLLEIAGDSENPLRLDAIQAFGEIAPIEYFPKLIQWVVAAKDQQEEAVTQLALTAACARMPQRDVCAEQLTASISAAPPEAKTALLEQLGSMGGPVALKCLAQCAMDSSPDTQDDATRILGTWIGADVGPVLLDLATTLKNNKFKVRALSGYIRIASQFGMPHEDKMDMCRRALAVAQHDKHRERVLQILGRNPSSTSLGIAVGLLDNANLKRKAASVALSIAQRTIEEDPKPVAEAMQRILDAGVGGNIAKRAKGYLDRAKRE